MCWLHVLPGHQQLWYWTESSKNIAASAPGDWFNIASKHLIERSRKASKAWDQMLNCLYCFDIWQVPRQQCCQGICQMSEQSGNCNHRSRAFKDFARSYNKMSYAIMNCPPPPPPPPPGKVKQFLHDNYMTGQQNKTNIPLVEPCLWFGSFRFCTFFHLICWLF